MGKLQLIKLNSFKKNDKRVLSFVLINNEFDFSCEIKEDMLLRMPVDVPYGALEEQRKNLQNLNFFNYFF